MTLRNMKAVQKIAMRSGNTDKVEIIFQKKFLVLQKLSMCLKHVG